jgi:hypothetical protein
MHASYMHVCQTKNQDIEVMGPRPEVSVANAMQKDDARHEAQM